MFIFKNHARAASLLWLVACAVFCSWLFIATTPANAQSETSRKIEACPIPALPAVAMVAFTEEVADNSVFSGTIAITNPTTYTMPGMRVGVGLYSSAEGTTPEFWTVTPNELTLLSRQTIEQDLQLDTSAVSPGTYTLRLFVAQGETELFASALRGQSITPAVEITTVASSTDDTVLAVEFMSGGVVATTTVDISSDFGVQTTASDPAEVRTLVSRHSVPLGSATEVDAVESFAGTTTNEIGAVVPGPYTAYALHQKPNAFTAVVKNTAVVQTAEQNYLSIYPYISVLGASEYPLSDGATATACVDFYSPDGARIAATPEPIALDFAVKNAAGAVAAQNPQQTPRFQNFATFTMADVPGDAVFSAILSTKPRGGQSADFVPVQSIDASYDCTGECAPSIGETVTDFADTDVVRSSFWFYFGIVLAAALVLYLMLRRMDPQDEDLTYQPTDEIQ